MSLTKWTCYAYLQVCSVSENSPTDWNYEKVGFLKLNEIMHMLDMLIIRNAGGSNAWYTQTAYVVLRMPHFYSHIHLWYNWKRKKPQAQFDTCQLLDSKRSISVYVHVEHSTRCNFVPQITSSIEMSIHRISVKRMQCIEYCRCSQHSGTQPRCQQYTPGIFYQIPFWRKCTELIPSRCLQNSYGTFYNMWYIRRTSEIISPQTGL